MVCSWIPRQAYEDASEHRVLRRNNLLPFFVLGTRPEIIKMAPVVHEFERRGIDCYLLHTGQHYSESLSENIFRDMQLREPDTNLNIGSGSHAEQTAKALVGIESELLRVKPDIVLVLGDTNAVLSAALAAVKLGIPVGHVEAGLRSYDMRMPEEHNRRVTDHLSNYLFAPTKYSAKILKSENVWGEVHVTGNTVIDALEMSLPSARKNSTIRAKLGLKEFLLLTLHRAENVDDSDTLKGIIDGLTRLNRQIVFAAHPRTVARLQQFNLMEQVKSSGLISVIDPPGYLDFLMLLDGCSFVLTDSGGIQEEATAPSINKRVFVLRESTERPEAVRSGHAVVVGTNPDEFPKMITDGMKASPPRRGKSPFGTGDAARRIVDVLVQDTKIANRTAQARNPPL